MGTCSIIPYIPCTTRVFLIAQMNGIMEVKQRPREKVWALGSLLGRIDLKWHDVVGEA